MGKQKHNKNKKRHRRMRRRGRRRKKKENTKRSQTAPIDVMCLVLFVHLPRLSSPPFLNQPHRAKPQSYAYPILP